MRYDQINTFSCQSAKMNGSQRKTLVSPLKMHCAYCSMLNGTSRAATFTVKKIKPVALAIVRSAGIRQVVKLISQ